MFDTSVDRQFRFFRSVMYLQWELGLNLKTRMYDRTEDISSVLSLISIVPS